MGEIKLPELADGVTHAIISMWHYGEGDSIKKDDDLVELVTDKATFNMPSPVSGKVVKQMFAEGETAKVGDVIAIIEE
jgi:pyruvate/2-oxoglutarate dehydrogenase complex dihydrolipoamide acyltransferase (E2) component